MRILGEFGRDDLATVYVASLKSGVVEFVESLEPPIPREKKWVLIVSSMFGCPVRCLMCDANAHYGGKLSAKQILDQIEWMIERRYPDREVPAAKFKVQFARMGEPSLNDAVIDVLDALPRRLKAPGLLPCLSTVAPQGRDGFFEALKQIKDRRYAGGRFQLQFSIHSTDEDVRDRLIPIRKWGLAEIARYGQEFRRDGDRKITLNFAATRGCPIDALVLRRFFDPAHFLVKLTPLNPTDRVRDNGLDSAFDPAVSSAADGLVDRLMDAGFEVLLSIGELEENLIGSNCGQYVSRLDPSGVRIKTSYETARYAAPLPRNDSRTPDVPCRILDPLAEPRHR